MKKVSHARAAKRFLHKLPTRQGREPRRPVADRPRTCASASPFRIGLKSRASNAHTPAARSTVLIRIDPH